jgi:hypothetical protein
MMSMAIVVGFDSGGATDRAFGWCIVDDHGRGVVAAGSEHYAGEALEKVERILRGRTPAAIAIDAPLFWGTPAATAVAIHTEVGSMAQASTTNSFMIHKVRYIS